MKNLKWRLLFIIAFLVGCGSSSPTDVKGATQVAPIATEQNMTVKENTENNPITLKGTDEDGDTLTYKIVTQPKHGTVKLSGKVATYTPTANYFGTDSFDFKVNDGKVDSQSAKVSITVTEVKEPIDETKTNYTLVLKSAYKVAGYEVYLKFNNTIPLEDEFTLDNDFLASTGRTVNNLGLDINSTTNKIKFGAFSFGSNDGVAGEFTPLNFKLTKGDVSIVKEICVDKNANKISCDIQLHRK